MLKCRADGRFKIVQFTDLHIGYPNNDADHQTLNELRDCLATLDADLLIFTGDQIWCYGENNPYRSFQQVIDCLNQSTIPVIMTYGNHDSEHGRITRAELRQMEMQLQHRVWGDHATLIRDRLSEAFAIYDAAGQRIIKQLFVFDSGDYVSAAVGEQLAAVGITNQYAYVYPEQIDWFNQVCRKTDHGDERLLFLHIPLVEYQQAQAYLQTGQCLEAICCSAINSGLFASLLAQSLSTAVFCGHDHDNDFTAEWLGVGLHYGRISGYNVYGQFPRGYREITLYETQKLTTTIISYAEHKEGGAW